MKKISFLTFFLSVLASAAALLSSLPAAALHGDPSISKAIVSTAYFQVGIGNVDVIPHQIVRANNDYLYVFSYVPSSGVLRMYRTAAPGLPVNGSAFAAPIQITETSFPIGIDAVYDGSRYIHVLMNLLNGSIKDYPFDTTANSFNSPILLASNGGTVTSGGYGSSSGAAGMQDKSGNLHVVYWTNGNHIQHRAYSYNGSTNVLTPLTAFTQVDTAGGANHPSLAVSPLDNSLTVAWVSQADNPTMIRTRTRTSGGTWGGVQSASTAPVWTSTDNGINIDQGPSLIIGSEGVKHLTYIQSFDPTAGDYGRIHYVQDAGAGWVDQALSAFTHDPALAINSAGELFIIGHGHPRSPSCLSMDDMCIIQRNANGTWGNPQLFASHPPTSTFDTSPSVRWSAVGFNRPDVIEFLFSSTPYISPTLYYGRIQTSTPAPNMNVIIGGVLRGSYFLQTGQQMRVNYPGLDSGPMVVKSTDGTPIIAALRDAWTPQGQTSMTSFAQMMGLPAGQLSDSYYFPAYNNLTLDEQLRFANVGLTDTTVSVTIGGVVRGMYLLHPNQQARANYAGLDSGPVVVSSSGGVKIIAAMRDAWTPPGGSGIISFVQTMGLPAGQLSDRYYFPAYNNVTLNEQLRFGNVGLAETTVTVTIGGVVRGTYLLHPSEQKRVNYAGLDSGPVIVSSSGGVKIIAAIRDAWAPPSRSITSFSQLMGLPASALSTKYYFPAYNNLTLNEQLRFGNVGLADTTVTVTIGGVVRGTYLLHPNQQARVNYTGLDSGPLVVSSSGGVPIIAALRDAWVPQGQTGITSFIQMMGLPSGLLSDTYYFPSYNNVTLNEQLRFGVP